MDEFSLLIALRMAERVLAVAIAGLTIYLGFRLFANLPTSDGSSGKIELPGFGVVLSRVGPGVFFAVFGAAVLIWSLANPVAYQDQERSLRGAFSERPQPPHQAPGDPSRVTDAQPATPQQVALASQSIQVLNCARQVLTSAAVGMEPADVEEGFRVAREALLESVWQPQWGSIFAYRESSLLGEPPVSAEVDAVVSRVLPGCPS